MPDKDGETLSWSANLVPRPKYGTWEVILLDRKSFFDLDCLVVFRALDSLASSKARRNLMSIRCSVPSNGLDVHISSYVVAILDVVVCQSICSKTV